MPFFFQNSEEQDKGENAIVGISRQAIYKYIHILQGKTILASFYVSDPVWVIT